jgi:hypothetical protein
MSQVKQGNFKVKNNNTFKHLPVGLKYIPNIQFYMNLGD